MLVLAQKTHGQPGSAFFSLSKISTRSKAEQEKFLGTQIANAATWNEWHRKMQQQAPIEKPVETQVIVLMDPGASGVQVCGCDVGVKLDTSPKLNYLKKNCLDLRAPIRHFCLRAEWESRNYDGEQLTGSEADAYIKQLRREVLMGELQKILKGYRWSKYA